MYDLFTCSWILFARILLRIFASMFISDIGLSFFFCCHLFLISSALLGPCISVLYCAHLCMECSFGISNFLEEISSLSHSIVFLYFFAFFFNFLISSCYFLRLCIQLGIAFPLSFAFCFFSFLSYLF
ncbi:hypothetical protein G4228_015758 [Cervus hanglu yarkandensis]|nr:hypothetical protein G4228_015758 [Cervus hanglu yarkandensis]